MTAGNVLPTVRDSNRDELSYTQVSEWEPGYTILTTGVIPLTDIITDDYVKLVKEIRLKANNEFRVYRDPLGAYWTVAQDSLIIIPVNNGKVKVYVEATVNPTTLLFMLLGFDAR